MKRCSIQNEDQFDTVKNEIACLESFSGPYVVKLIAKAITTRGNYKQALMLLEYCPGGHLLDRLLQRNGEYANPTTICQITGQILMGLRPMHCANPPVIHRDLKLENILFGQDGNVRLCDFGSCVRGHISLSNSSERAYAEERIARETTQMYRAPEMIDLHMRDKLTEKTDIWVTGSAHCDYVV